MFTLDIGNSRVKWGLWEDRQLTQTGEFEHKIGEDSKAAFEISLGAMPKQDSIWVSCVGGARCEMSLRKWLKLNWESEPVMLRATAELGGVTNCYIEPEQLGSDRWAAMLGAYEFFKSAVCIIDCGTATTVDVMNNDGKHLGGRIMPGLEMMRSSLLNDTAIIKEVLGQCPEFTDNTADGVTSGIVRMLRAGLMDACDCAKKILGDDMKIIITGGSAGIILPLPELPDVRYDPHLVLKGIFYAAEQTEK